MTSFEYYAIASMWCFQVFVVQLKVLVLVLANKGDTGENVANALGAILGTLFAVATYNLVWG